MSSRSNEPAAAVGYASAAHAAALSHMGRPLALPGCGGHLIERAIPGGGTDLGGPYPLFSCADWSALPADLDALAPGHVSLVLVADPFGPPAAALSPHFDICRPLHAHAAIDLSRPLAPSRGHRRRVRAALGRAEIEIGPAGPALARDWARLYAGLAARHGIRDARAFPPESLAAMLEVPGAEAATARIGGEVVGIDLYYLQGEVAHAHLSAYSQAGYEIAVSYPMIAAAAEHFAPRARWLNLGGVPAGGSGGIAQFKRGWGTVPRESHLCGRILDPAAYARLAPGADPSGYFPAYRAGEYASPAIRQVR